MAKEKSTVVLKADPHDPEDFDVTAEALEMARAARKGRGKQLLPIKRPVSIRLDEDLLAALKATGSGWQGRVNAILRERVLAK